MPKTLLSIVVPIYNVENYLAECLDSLTNQNLDGIEVLLVDDGSTDGSGDIARTYSKQHPNHFIYLSKQNGGLSDARNYGVSHACGDYIAFLDSDDYIAPGAIETITRELRQNIDILCFSMAEVDEQGEYIRFIPANAVLVPGHYDVGQTPLLFSKSLPNACNKIFKASLFKKHEITFPKGLWYEDLATVPRLMVNANTITIIEDEIYYYRSREGAITKTFSLKVMDIYTVLGQLKRHLQTETKVDLTLDLNTWYTNLTVITLARFSAIPPSKPKDEALSVIKKIIASQFSDPKDIFLKSYSVLRYKVFVLLIRIGFIKSVAKIIEKLVKFNKIKI